MDVTERNPVSMATTSPPTHGRGILFNTGVKKLCGHFAGFPYAEHSFC